MYFSFKQSLLCITSFASYLLGRKMHQTVIRDWHEDVSYYMDQSGIIMKLFSLFFFINEVNQ